MRFTEKQANAIWNAVYSVIENVTKEEFGTGYDSVVRLHNALQKGNDIRIGTTQRQFILTKMYSIIESAWDVSEVVAEMEVVNILTGGDVI